MEDLGEILDLLNQTAEEGVAFLETQGERLATYLTSYLDDEPDKLRKYQFEEIEESRPIKRQSPARGRSKAAKARKTKSKVEEPSSQRHRRSIDEKENFNYFKRWLDRMQD